MTSQSLADQLASLQETAENNGVTVDAEAVTATAAELRSAVDAVVAAQRGDGGADAEAMAGAGTEADSGDGVPLIVGRALRFPLKFESAASHANFVALAAALTFKPEHVADVEAASGRDAEDVAAFGLMGLYLTRPELDAGFLAQLSRLDLSQAYGIPEFAETAVSPGVYEQVDAPTKFALCAMQNLCREIGSACERAGVASLGELVIGHVAADTAAAAVDGLAAALPSRLVRDDVVGGYANVALARRIIFALAAFGHALAIAPGHAAPAFAELGAAFDGYPDGAELADALGFPDMPQLDGYIDARRLATLRKRGIVTGAGDDEAALAAGLLGMHALRKALGVEPWIFEHVVDRIL
ncbi:uncharacterized protein AMSG_02456 [Thecamonas trahens ATCC 50062]|uniref:Uncharacterized protein n=1 Tax=Thecamonas trahens ATCC 50062 TaxID=461836 RepID=A0A0L0D804_THETB|nr:hypothetical protein AMSG_02456 [Thecamonas trahens ATCC 50062]KNC47438.1 hypothetical protein AMSG_02456 [Thecamonas trahens ATCC 50062]|eukprot:XP_013759375.1 hypothetical protein AMSG_02456 [Thecamonas trahens ATCC 50062]